MIEIEPVITSLLDQDWYKFPMLQLFCNPQFEGVQARYRFYNRDNRPVPEGFDEQLRWQVEHIGTLQIEQSDVDFLLEKCYYMRPSFLKSLVGFSLNPDHVHITQVGDKLDVWIEGPLVETTFWEILLLRTISTLYFTMTGAQPDDDWLERAGEKAYRLTEAGAPFIDFGARRTAFPYVHKQVFLAQMQYLRQPGQAGGFVGTSMISYAKEYNMTPMGTHAHEAAQLFAGIYGYKVAIPKFLDAWNNEFRGSLGTALTDTFTTNLFLKYFDGTYAKLFDSVRHDSGDPLKFVDTMVANYEKLHIDPMSKTIIFSDGLNVQKVLRILEYCKNKIKCSFGIGTDFTNDIGFKALNIVIKLDAVARPGFPFFPVVKLSDVKTKNTGDPRAIEFAKYDLQIED